MTLNQTINRIKQIVLAHKQVRTFAKGLVSDFLNEHTTKYPAVFLQDNGGSISTGRHITTLNYKLFFADLVHVSQDTNDNEQDVQSDMVSIAMDVISQMNAGGYSDWKISTDNNLQLFVENDNDLHAGCVIDVSVSFMFSQNICIIPSDLEILIPIEIEMDTKVYDFKYTATGNENVTLAPAVLLGKKIIFVTRESAPIYKVNSNPDPAEFTWDNTTVVLGTATNPGERFLFLYRNY